MEQTPITIDFVYESAEIYTIYQWGRGSTGFREIMGHVEYNIIFNCPSLATFMILQSHQTSKVRLVKWLNNEYKVNDAL